MGQLLSWIRGPNNNNKNNPDLLDVAVEQQSQPSQTTPTPTAQVTTVKPAQYEATRSAASRAAGGPAAGGATAIDMSSSGATIVDMTAAAKRSAEAAAKTPPVSQVKATAAAAAAAPSPAAGSTRTATAAAGTTAPAAQTKPAPKDAAKSAAAPPPVRDTPKADPAKAAKPAGAVAPAAAGAAAGVSGKGITEAATPAQPKVQVEVPPQPAKAPKVAPALDPFDALASSLPSAEPLAPEPVYTGPEVHEHGVTTEEGKPCGVDERTLPPGYRYEDLTPAPVDLKPKDVPKPMSTDDALASLSLGFATAPTVSSSAQQEKMDSVDALSAGFIKSAPPAFTKNASSPVDKKAKMEPDFSLASVLSSPAPPQNPAEQKPKAQAPVAASLKDTKPKADKVDDLSLDALAALGDTLAAPEPAPESPKLRPEDIVSESELNAEKGVLVGERDDTIPPEYRFSKDDLKDLPAPKPEPSLAPGEALDFLSGDFMTGPAAPVDLAPVCVPSAPPTQAKVDDLSALDVLAGDFMTSTQAAAVQAPLPPSAKKTPKNDACDSAKPSSAVKVSVAKPALDDALSLDPFAALSDTLPAPEPIPEPPELRPEDIVSEGKMTSEKGVRVGEREDTLPPEYRFSAEDLKDLPAPKPEPTLNTCEALDILSGDFTGPPPASVCSPPKPPTTALADDAALDALAGDFVATAVVAPAVACATSQPTQSSRQVPGDAASAMDALSDTLMDIQPVPEPAPKPMKDIANEKKIVEERLIKMGEDDDTLPPEYRPSEEDIKKAAAEAKLPKEKPMGDDAALAVLSGDFAVSADPPGPVAAPCSAPAPVPDAQPLKPMAGPALDSLASSLLPEPMETMIKGEKAKQKAEPSVDSSDTLPPGPVDAKAKGEKAKGKSKSRSKSKKHHAEDPSPIDQLAGELSTDVSLKKGGKS